MQVLYHVCLAVNSAHSLVQILSKLLLGTSLDVSSKIPSRGSSGQVLYSYATKRKLGRHAHMMLAVLTVAQSVHELWSGRLHFCGLLWHQYSSSLVISPHHVHLALMTDYD